jgi:5-formyltetrahydrofolate cyclo-ligase
MDRAPQDLRTELKARRKAMTQQEINAASNAIADIFWQESFSNSAETIAIYMATAGEADCQPLMNTGWLRKKRIFAPILSNKHLNFAPLERTSKMTSNRFNILEPVYQKQHLIAPHELDIVIVPLVAFDTMLNRVGMGAGYYDRTFGFTKQARNRMNPLLIGIAYSFQHVDELEPKSWDVPLHVVITEKECIKSH